MMSWSSFDACKFCHSNGEAEVQYRSHLVKNSSGLVTCPVLRSFTCPICKATGDFAHTQRYCPLNKDGKFNLGASLTELKKKKNAAGNFPSSKKVMWPLHSYSKVYPPSSSSTVPGTAESLPPPPFKRTSSLPGTGSYKMTTDPLPHHPMTDPLPSCYRPPSPPTILSSQPPSAQLSLYRHIQYLEYYQHKQLQHEAEIAMLQASVRVPRSSPPCYMRNFPSPMSTTPPRSPPDKFSFPDMEDCGRGRPLVGSTADKNKDKKNEVAEGDFLGNMLAELREGTEEMDMY